MATKTSLGLRPLGDRVVVKPLEAKEETVSLSGIIIPDADKKEKPSKGKVVAVGLGRLTEDGKRISMEVKVGDVVLFKRPWDEPAKIEGVEYYILSESEITVVLD